ncbi:HdeA/HdeB family protein [Roseiarcus fermentans]|uniref:HdeA/HdeB family protein n=1 Tax=Roseiarcus fermentans TaxID=1473586 RepID=A0A366FVG4_9HYPH|nr:HdeA/HdeB family chaperone [Roseiarcus fermentans]RBP17689.1 HdeA/HdeB family protein [Roseiarcus fermentans]
MKKAILISTVAVLMSFGAAKANPVDLSAYVDANGFIDVTALMCGQLANTYQEDANALMSWYSGWYNGLSHHHFLDYKKGRETEHLVIEYCKAHPDQKIIHAMGIVLHEERAEGMMQEK